VAADLRKSGILYRSSLPSLTANPIGVSSWAEAMVTFAPEVEYFLPAPPLSLDLADFNGVDILISSPFFAVVKPGPMALCWAMVLARLGHQLRCSRSIPARMPHDRHRKDLNGDGLPDLVSLKKAESFLGPPTLAAATERFKHVSISLRGGGFLIRQQRACDIDETLLYAVTAKRQRSCEFFKGTCDGSFVEFPTLPLWSAERSAVALATWNGDGHLDVVPTGGLLRVIPFLCGAKPQTWSRYSKGMVMETCKFRKSSAANNFFRFCACRLNVRNST